MPSFLALAVGGVHNGTSFAKLVPAKMTMTSKKGRTASFLFLFETLSGFDLLSDEWAIAK